MSKSETVLTYTTLYTDMTYEYTNKYRQHYWFMYTIQQSMLILKLTREALQKIF